LSKQPGPVLTPFVSGIGRFPVIFDYPPRFTNNSAQGGKPQRHIFFISWHE
jgi:hypothetical protein